MRFTPVLQVSERDKSELNFFFLFVKKMKFGHVIIIVCMYPYGLLKLSAPTPFFAGKPAPLVRYACIMG